MKVSKILVKIRDHFILKSKIISDLKNDIQILKLENSLLLHKINRIEKEHQSEIDISNGIIKSLILELNKNEKQNEN
jgi:hypothetical protein